jgi:hypothetical protein
MLNESMMGTTSHGLKQAQIKLNRIKHNNSLPHETHHIPRWNKPYGVGHSIICKKIFIYLSRLQSFYTHDEIGKK